MNANLTALGKRKNKPGQKQPDWLFPSTQKVETSPSIPPPPAPAAAPVNNDSKMKDKQAKKIAKDLLKRQDAGETPKSAIQSPLVELIGAYLTDNEYTSASKALKTERAKRGGSTESVEGTPSLDIIYMEWLESKGKGLEKALVAKAKGKSKKMAATKVESVLSGSDVEMADAPPAKKASKESSSESSSDSSSDDSSSSSDSDADNEEEQAPKASPPKVKTNALKRKAPSSSSSSSSGSSSSDSSSSESDAPKSKKVKTTKAKSESSGSSSSSSDSDSSSDDEVHESKVIKRNSNSSSSDSSSSDSDDSVSSTQSAARKVPLPTSDSDSDSSSSSSDSDSASSPIVKKKKSAIGSDTSATLSGGSKKKNSSSSDSSSDSSSSSDSDTETKVKVVATTTIRALSPPLPPSPVAKVSKKKVNAPFQRIKADTVVDERLASNAYVPYDYAQKAHEDLIVTRGKGFTKEKNKKKRGSYRGGFIDVDGKKGIKFDD